jgi:hypothetical protein
MAPEARYLCVNDGQPIEYARRLSATGIGIVLRVPPAAHTDLS